MPVRSLERIDPRQRVEAMRSWFETGDVPVDFRVSKNQGLAGHLGSASIDSLGVTDMLVTGADGSLRRRTKPGASNPDLLLVNIADAGTSAVSQNGNQVSLPPGLLVLTSTRYDLEAHQRGSSHRFSIILPYRTLGLSARMIDSLLAKQLHVDQGLSATVSSFLLRVARQAMESDVDLTPLVNPLFDMVRGVLAEAAGDIRAAREPLALTLFPRVMEYLRLRVFDPELSASAIAHQHGVSVRYLYTVLGREGVSLGEWVRERRAEEAARLLADRTCALTIADIAYRTGHADHAHFSRSFRRRYGMTPRDWRRLHHDADLVAS